MWQQSNAFIDLVLENELMVEPQACANASRGREVAVTSKGVRRVVLCAVLPLTPPHDRQSGQRGQLDFEARGFACFEYFFSNVI